jgi:hypothetical protein
MIRSSVVILVAVFCVTGASPAVSFRTYTYGCIIYISDISITKLDKVALITSNVDLQRSGKIDLVYRFERKLSGKLEKATYVM